MKPSHEARNASVKINDENAELFFQAVNCDHIAENYKEDSIFNFKEKTHDVRFVEIVNLLKGDVYFEEIQKTKCFAISKYNDKYYKTIDNFSRRKELNNHLYIVIISSYICREKEQIKKYDDYYKKNKEKYSK